MLLFHLEVKFEGSYSKTLIVWSLFDPIRVHVYHVGGSGSLHGGLIILILFLRGCLMG